MCRHFDWRIISEGNLYYAGIHKNVPRVLHEKDSKCVVDQNILLWALYPGCLQGPLNEPKKRSEIFAPTIS